MVKVLIVEDADSAASDLRDLVKSIVPRADITWVKDRDAAVAAIQTDEWDLVTCDLNIPSSRGVLDADESHGLTVHTTARQLMPGTPALFATGFATTANTASSLESGPTEYVYGPARIPLVQLTEKQYAYEQTMKISSLLTDLVALEAIPVTVEMSRDVKPLNPMVVRAAQRFAQMRGSAAARVIPTPGGLSDATPARLYLTDENGYELEIFMKVMSSAAAVRESQQYAKHLPTKLQPGAFSPVSFKMSYGLRKSAAIFYTLAAPCSSLFNVLRERPGDGPGLVRELRAKLGPWISAPSDMVEVRVGDLRRVKASDGKLRERGHLHYLTEFEDFEKEVVRMSRGTIHGDLHGENVLIDKHSSPLLIDFGDVGLGWLVDDPITLELSVVLHLEAPGRKAAWPKLDVANRWADPSAYAASSPWPDFILACRGWAMEVDSAAAVYAFAYCHAVRHLRYRDVQPELAVTLARSAVRAYFESSRTSDSK